MKQIRRSMLAIPALACVIALGLTTVGAQDPVKVAPNNYKVLIDNERVRVLQATIKPGDTIPMHSHPPNVIYPLTAGKVTFTTPDGKSVVVDLVAGDAEWHEAESHSAKNIGTAEARVLVVELKESSKPHKH